MLKVYNDGLIQLTRGDTAVLNIDITNDATGEAYAIQPEDELVLSMKRSVNDTEVCMQKRVKGTAQLLIEPADTGSLRFGRYVYDVQITTGLGQVYTVIGPETFEILPEVTC